MSGIGGFTMGMDMFAYLISKTKTNAGKISELEPDVYYIGKEEAGSSKYTDLLPYCTEAELVNDVAIVSPGILQEKFKIPEDWDMGHMCWEGDKLVVGFYSPDRREKTTLMIPEDRLKNYTDPTAHTYYVYELRKLKQWRNDSELSEKLNEEYHSDRKRDVENCGFHIANSEMRKLMGVSDHENTDEQAVFYCEWY